MTEQDEDATVKKAILFLRGQVDRLENGELELLDFSMAPVLSEVSMPDGMKTQLPTGAWTYTFTAREKK